MSYGACKNPRCDGSYYLCGKCRRQFPQAAKVLDERKRSAGQFSKDLPDGTNIYGTNGMDKKPGHKHGHRGDNFDRSPHSTIGSAAIGGAHTYDEHRNNRTKRW